MAERGGRQIELAPAASPSPSRSPDPEPSGFSRALAAAASSDRWWATATMAVTSVLAAGVLRLWQAPLSVPMYSRGDANYDFMLVKGLIDNLWYLKNPRLGAPAGQNLLDFPSEAGDQLQMLALKAMTLFSSSVGGIVNAYFLLSFPLVALVTFLVLRRLGCSRAAALVCSTLFSLQPYRFIRGEGHLFLAAYVAVPLGALLILRLAAGEPLFARGSGGRVGRFLTRRALATTAVCLVIGMTGVYYAVFTLLLLCSVAVLRALGGHLRALAPAAVISLLIAGTLAVNYLPAIVYRLEHGSNESAFMRVPSNSESNAFRLTDLVLPITHHRIKPLADMRQTVESTEDPTPSEARSSSLGLVGVIGFTYLAVVLLGAALGGGRWRAAPMRLRHAGVATSVAFLYGTLGGISALVAYEITPVLHGPARISPFIAFFSFLAVGALLDGLARRTGATRRGPVLLAFALAAVLVVGTFDQTTERFVPAYAEQARAWASTEAFVSDVERRLPPGASVFQLPIVEFPEGTPPSPTVSGYDNVSLYLHSHHLRWSYGAMRGRPGDWQARLNGADPTGVAEAAAQAGFQGIEVDRLAYTDVASRVVNELAELLGPPVVSSTDGRWVFYDLRPYARLVRAPLSAGVPAGYRLPPRLEFDAGFYAQEGPSTQPFRWEQALGRVQIVNLTKPVRRVLLTGVAYAAASATVRVTGAGVAHAFSATPDGTRFRIALDAPPGRTTLAIANDAPPGGAPGDPRDLRVRFVNLALVRG